MTPSNALYGVAAHHHPLICQQYGLQLAYLHLGLQGWLLPFLQERGIRAEERADARLHGGHITRVEQAQLNGDLNAVGREIPR